MEVMQDCEAWYYEQEDRQMFLRQQSSVQCMTAAWTAAAATASTVIIVYIFGFPAIILMAIRESRRYILVRVAIEDLAVHQAKISAWEWIPSSLQDLAKLKKVQHRFAAYVKSRLWKNRIANIAEIMIFGDPGAVKVEDSAEHTIELFIHKRSFSIHWQRDTITKGGCHVASRKDLLPSSPINPMAHAAGPDEVQRFMSFAGGSGKANPANNEEMPSIATDEQEDLGFGELAEEALLVVDGVHRMRAAMLKKQTKIDGGEMVVSHCTMMDHPYIEMTMAVFTQPYEDALYWYACWDIFRRSLMTGGVIMVQLFTSTEVAILYALVLSVVSITVHKHFDAFVMDEMDLLMLLILTSQFLLQVGIVGIWMVENTTSQVVIGVSLLVTQLILCCYSLVMMIPVFWPLYTFLYTSFKKLGNRRNLQK
eukprot:gene5061-6162_t